ncbi:hypothetical protein FXO38_17282 [Capsicum annuum]|nr:hypothetical protein FXO38_17282 [Capsicum annuum]
MPPQVQGPCLPVTREQPTVELVKVSDEIKSFNAYGKLRNEHTNARYIGVRQKTVAEAEKGNEQISNLLQQNLNSVPTDALSIAIGLDDLDMNIIDDDQTPMPIDATIMVGSFSQSTQPGNHQDDEIKFFKEMSFKDQNELSTALFIYCLKKDFRIKKVINSSNVFSYKCANPNCKWWLRAVKYVSSDRFFIHKHKNHHTCGSEHISGQNSHTTKKVLGEYFKSCFLDGKNPSTRVMANQLFMELGVLMNKHHCLTYLDRVGRMSVPLIVVVLLDGVNGIGGRGVGVGGHRGGTGGGGWQGQPNVEALHDQPTEADLGASSGGVIGVGGRHADAATTLYGSFKKVDIYTKLDAKDKRDLGRSKNAKRGTPDCPTSLYSPQDFQTMIDKCMWYEDKYVDKILCLTRKRQLAYPKAYDAADRTMDLKFYNKFKKKSSSRTKRVKFFKFKNFKKTQPRIWLILSSSSESQKGQMIQVLQFLSSERVTKIEHRALSPRAVLAVPAPILFARLVASTIKVFAELAMVFILDVASQATESETILRQIFHVHVYALVDPGAFFSFVTPCIAVNFRVSPEILAEPFSVFTLVGKTIIAQRVYKNCLIIISQKVTSADLVELEITDFDVIIDMD